MDESVIEKVFNITEVAIENAVLDNSEDEEIVLAALDCLECAITAPPYKKRRVWVKQWRENRVERGAFSFLMNDLLKDMSSFLNYIRMTPETFNFILSKIENDIKKQDTTMRNAITPAEKLAATIRYLATGESLKSTNYQTRLSQPFLSTAIPETCEAIWKNFRDAYLKFPTTKNEWEAIAENFAIKWQFPNCLGALDGKHINFNALRRDGSYFFNYKGTNSIVLLALVDADCRFIYIDVGCNGRTHDAGVLLQSKLKTIIDKADEHFPPDKIIGNGRKLPYVIVGDDAFPLQKHLMKPYSHSTSKKEQQIYNIRLSRARQVVERAFGIMASRFRIFQTKMNLSAEKVDLVTKTCCVLHNLLIEKHYNYSNDILLNESEETNSEPFNAEAINRKGAAQTIRQGFEQYFNNEGRLPWQDKKL